MRYSAVFQLRNKLVKNNGKSFYVMECKDEININAESAEDALKQAKSIMEKKHEMLKEEIENNQNWVVTAK